MKDYKSIKKMVTMKILHYGGSQNSNDYNDAILNIKDWKEVNIKVKWY